MSKVKGSEVSKKKIWKKILFYVLILIALLVIAFFANKYFGEGSREVSLTGHTILNKCQDWAGDPANDGASCTLLFGGCGLLDRCICAEGKCMQTKCDDECSITIFSTISCVDSTHYKNCTWNSDKDICYELGNTTSTGSNYCVNNFLIPACTENDWSYTLSVCNSSNQILKTWTLKAGVRCYPATNKVSEIIACNFIAPYTPHPCASLNYTNWTSCINGNRTRQIDLSRSSPAGCNISETPSALIDSLSETCLVSCTSIIYSNWTSCINGTRTRNVSSTIPALCNLASVNLLESCSLESLASSSGMVLSVSNKVVSAKLDGVSKVDFFIGNRVVNISKINISYTEENIAGYGNLVFIKANNFSYDSKTVYFPRSGNSSGVCFVDLNLTEEQVFDTEDDALYNCTYLSCNGVKRGYTCNLSADTFTIKGLKNSLIIEMFGNICGDAICTDEENCSVCSEDCGNCTIPLDISLDTSLDDVLVEEVDNISFEEEFVPVEEDTAPVETTAETADTSSNWIYYLIGGLILGIIVIVLFIYFYFKNKEKSEGSKQGAPFNSGVPPVSSMPPTTSFPPRNVNQPRPPFNPNFPPKQNVPFR